MDNVTDVIVHSIEYSSQLKPKVSFGVLKVTGICNGHLLDRLSELLVSESPNLPSSFSIKEYSIKDSGRTPIIPNPNSSALNKSEQQSLELFLHRLKRIGDVCEKHQIPLLIDAEHSHYQVAIDQCFLLMAKTYNNKKKIETPLIFNTYQMYLKDSFKRLQYDFQFLEERLDTRFATKLVRGAYIKYESERFIKLKLPTHPIHNSLQETHDSYNAGVQFLLDKNSNVVIATHNRESVLKATEYIHRKGYPRNQGNFSFAQLLGMGDYLSYALAQSGYNSHKYVVFGPVDELLPFFSRRLIENSDVRGGSTQETNRLRRELLNRITYRNINKN